MHASFVLGGPKRQLQWATQYNEPPAKDYLVPYPHLEFADVVDLPTSLDPYHYQNGRTILVHDAVVDRKIAYSNFCRKIANTREAQQASGVIVSQEAASGVDIWDTTSNEAHQEVVEGAPE